MYLERLTKPESDQSSSKGKQGQMDISSAFISNEQAPVSMEPGKGALDNPTVFSKMRRTFYTTSGNPVFDIPRSTGLPAKEIVISFVCVKFLRMTSRFPMEIA